MIVELISAITGLIVATYVLFKTIKYCKTPCFTIQTQDGTPEDASIIKYIANKVTPRTAKAKEQSVEMQSVV